VAAAASGDFMQQTGIAGSGFPAFPLRTMAANWRLRRLIARNVPGWLIPRLRHGARVPDEGLTLLIDYDDPAVNPFHRAFGHVLYTRSHWLPLHCELVGSCFYAA
jgi:hypothetical protein